MKANALHIAVASGKGGTGKTTLATCLAAVLAKRGKSVAYLDCDVEEPNGHIFLKPQISKTTEVEVLIPKVDLDKCTFCGECAKICEFNAIAVLLDKVMVFPSLCHSCGGCFHICPERAITEIPRPIGTIADGIGMGVRFIEGRLNIGEAMAPPVTTRIKHNMPDMDVTIIDAPPGTSCPVIEAVRDTDFVVLVTEPTPFGLNDLQLAVGMVRSLQLPFGVVINRSDLGDDRVVKYCADEKVDVMMQIPFNRALAESYAVGKMIDGLAPELTDDLTHMYDTIESRVAHD
ncbi:MAG: ATP-binding protein [candidate division Zixibacteria bacterium]|nr:ATP-binding protein [candidate division Zixibacteria bacterium]